jgi:aerobic carbon-monoxide dehydrogenase small subunit
MNVSFVVNGQAVSVTDVRPAETLLEVLRDRLALTGAKNACEQGECGSCSVSLNGVLVCSCLVLAGQAEGASITTIEGLARDGELDPVQRAFVRCGAVQCGFCTPGLVLAAHDLLRKTPDPGDDEIREALAGNLCRCTGYQKIVDAVRSAAREMAGTTAR